MKRREFITLLGGAAAWPSVVRAQSTPRRPVVAFVHAVIPQIEMAGSAPVSPLARAFVHGLRDLGWIEGRTVVIERRSAEGQPLRLRDELLNGEIFYTLREAQIVIESWRRHYNTIRPHASIGYKPPAPEVFVPAFAAWPAALRRPAPPATLAQRPTLN
jgi:hypothetical protein